MGLGVLKKRVDSLKPNRHLLRDIAGVAISRITPAQFIEHGRMYAQARNTWNKATEIYERAVSGTGTSSGNKKGSDIVERGLTRELERLERYNNSSIIGVDWIPTDEVRAKLGKLEKRKVGREEYRQLKHKLAVEGREAVGGAMGLAYIFGGPRPRKYKHFTHAILGLSIIGLIGGIFFLSPTLTGNVIGNLNQTSSNVIGVGLLVVGAIAGFFWNKKSKGRNIKISKRKVRKKR